MIMIENMTAKGCWGLKSRCFMYVRHLSSITLHKLQSTENFYHLMLYFRINRDTSTYLYSNLLTLMLLEIDNQATQYNN